jgi:hypothetical protein
VIDTSVHAQEPPQGHLRTADLLAALSLASDLAVGLRAEHAVRSCYIAMHIGEQMQLPAEKQIDLYYAMLLMDAGCTAWTSQLAMSPYPVEYGTDCSSPCRAANLCAKVFAIRVRSHNASPSDWACRK